MNHLIICTEYPPAHIPPGGIGTYTYNIAHLLAEAGETVHVIGRRWPGAPDPIVESCNGRLVVHRVPLDEVLPGSPDPVEHDVAIKILDALRHSNFSEQCFSWQVALYAEMLVDDAAIDVIESQEINAPLYYFQLRRALGFGPRRQPPCIVHLHSSSEQIVRYNEWDAGEPYWVKAKRLEDYSIAAADALLCPSQFLARQTELELGLEAGTVTSIPLPIGDTPLLERSHEVWTSGSVCYVGRLEPRKGIIEWVDAAVSAADDHPGVHFEFIGADLPYTESESVQQFITKRIPSRLMERFHFRGSKSRDAVLQYLGQARIAVVPSRWENFPNTCVEAMCSGLPVLATPNGGMAEMIEDEQTGWLAKDTGSGALARALQRALETSPTRLAEMGARAATNIRRLCDNDETVQRHLQFRSSVARHGADRSLRLPPNLPHSGRQLTIDPAICRESNTTAEGIALIVDATADMNALTPWIASIEQQRESPGAVVLLVPRAHATSVDIANHPLAKDWHIITVDTQVNSAMINQGIRMILDSGKDIAAFCFMDTMDRLRPDFLRSCAAVLRHCSDLGIVSMWKEHTVHMDSSSLVTNPCPAFPYQLVDNEVDFTPVIRTDALIEANLLPGDMEPGFAIWNLVNMTLAAGWKAVTIPELLSERTVQQREALPSDDRMYRKVLANTPDVVAENAQQVIHLLRARTRANAALTTKHFGITIVRPRDLLKAPPSQKLRIAGKFIRDPRPGLRFMSYHLKANFRRLIAGMPGTIRARNRKDGW